MTDQSNVEKAQALILHITGNQNISNEYFDTLYILLSNFSKKDIITLINEYHLLLIFSFIDWNDIECQKIGLSLAKLILSSLSWNDIYNLPETDIILLLDPRNVVCSLFLNQVTDALVSEMDRLDPLTIPDNMVNCIFKLISNNNLEISMNAQNVIKTIAQMKPNGSDYLFGNQERMIEIKSSFNSPESKLRIYELAIQIARIDTPAFEVISNSGLFDELVNFALIEADLLVQMNTLELMKDFIELDCGFQFLHDKRIIEKLDNKMNSLFEQPLGEMLFPGYITLFGRIAYRHPREMLSDETRFKQFLVNALSIFPTLNSNRLIVLETFAHIASTVPGKLALYELVGSSIMDSVMSYLGDYLTQSPNEFRGRSVDALRLFLELPVGDSDPNMCAIIEKWFSKVRGSSLDTIKTLLSFARLPFIDVKLAALKVIKSIVIQKWGIELCLNYGGFTEYILDRKTDQEKDCKEEKYSIVVLMVSNPSASQVFDGPLLLRYKQHVKEGPLFVRPQAEVDVSGD